MGATQVSNAMPPAQESSCDLKVADAVWVGAALLHIQNPTLEQFTTEEIVASVRHHHLTSSAEKSVWQHVNQHCVANRKPQPNRPCMLTATGQGKRRLYRPGDRRDDGRKGAPTHPEWDQLPAQYQSLRGWYEEWIGTVDAAIADPLLAAIGSGREIWKDEHADEYVSRLRANWGGAG